MAGKYISYKKGDLVTASDINDLFLETFKRLNAIDPSQFTSLTTGQFISEDDDGNCSVILNTSSDQVLISDDFSRDLGVIYQDIENILRRS